MLASAMNDAVPSHFRTDDLAKSEASDSTPSEDLSRFASRHSGCASAFKLSALPDHRSLRLLRCLSPVCTLLSTSLSAMRSSFHARTHHAFANPTRTPNHALQRTPGFGVQLPSAAGVRPAQSRAVRPAMKPGTARAFALRWAAPMRVPGPESLSLGSLGVFSRRP